VLRSVNIFITSRVLNRYLNLLIREYHSYTGWGKIHLTFDI
jgi:hypothetical protein